MALFRGPCLPVIKLFFVGICLGFASQAYANKGCESYFPPSILKKALPAPGSRELRVLEEKFLAALEHPEQNYFVFSVREYLTSEGQNILLKFFENPPTSSALQGRRDYTYYHVPLLEPHKFSGSKDIVELLSWITKFVQNGVQEKYGLETSDVRFAESRYFQDGNFHRPNPLWHIDYGILNIIFHIKGSGTERSQQASQDFVGKSGEHKTNKVYSDVEALMPFEFLFFTGVPERDWRTSAEQQLLRENKPLGHRSGPGGAEKMMFLIRMSTKKQSP